MTPEELDEARAKEAVRIWGSQPLASGDISAPATIAARLAREGWKPPEPVVDPDILAFREWLAKKQPLYAEPITAGKWDDVAEYYLAGARMAREQERERAKVLVEFAEDIAKFSRNYAVRAYRDLAKYRGEA